MREQELTIKVYEDHFEGGYRVNVFAAQTLYDHHAPAIIKGISQKLVDIIAENLARDKAQEIIAAIDMQAVANLAIAAAAKKIAENL